MKKLQAEITKRLVAAILITAVVIGLSAFAVHTPIQNETSLTRSLKGVQTDRATLFRADRKLSRCHFVEMVLPETSESKAAAENMKLVAATL